MRTADCDLLIIPGHGNSGPDHWQTRWEEKLSSARRVDQRDWDHAVKDVWVEAIGAAIGAASKPVVVIAHSLGVLAAAAALQAMPKGKVAGAFLVSPPGKPYIISRGDIDHAFAHISHDPLPVSSTLIASRNDPYCPWLDAEELAYAWGSAFIDAGEAGHHNTESGHGPWPEGLMQFAGFMAKL